MRFGYPDNPVSETKHIFTESYFVSVYSSVQKARKKTGFNTIELHIQTFNELDYVEEITSYVTQLQQEGIGFVMHAPFMELRKDGFGHILPVKVSAIKDCKKAPLEDIKKAIKFCSMLNIPILTIHASSSLKFMADTEFSLFKEIAIALSAFSNEHNVVLAVETGGLRQNQLDELMDSGIKINLDTAHLVVDLIEQGMSAEEANDAVFAFFEKNKRHIPTVHISQTLVGKDVHLDIKEPGVVSMNQKLLDYIAINNHDIVAICEFKPNIMKEKE